ncbi:MAG TPA: hypothetical protein VLV17_03025 [Anaeromyxobacteraceae bacterium]|nr:hypothetical protein [Anaeromyxobacteraceae bacterium]
MIGYLDEQWMKRGANDEERNKHGRRWADVVRLLAGCGMHVTEARRFAEAGTIEAIPGRQPTGGKAAVLAVLLHETFKVAVSEATKMAAERVRAAGSCAIAHAEPPSG